MKNKLFDKSPNVFMGCEKLAVCKVRKGNGGGWLVKTVTVGHSGEEDSCLRLDHCNVRSVMNELYEGLYEVYLHVIASLKSGGGILDCTYMGGNLLAVQSLILMSYFFCIFEHFFWQLIGWLCQKLQSFLKMYERHMVYMPLFGPYQPFI